MYLGHYRTRGVVSYVGWVVLSAFAIGETSCYRVGKVRERYSF
jgi:hypothetical protein